VSVALTLSAAPNALAFGAEGHEVVALVADHQLTAEVRARVAAILSLEPGATLASISNWADQTRERSTAAWHYVNMPRGSDCVYVAPRDCPGGNCVVGALAAQVKRLTTSTGQDQLQALKYVVHFVGDVHQPLHAGYADDKGGNTYQLRAFGKGTNLHAVWDSGLVRDIDPSANSLAATLLAGSVPTAALSFAPDQWAMESCRIVNRPDFYPVGHKLTGAYAQTFEPVVLGRLYLAGLRLAALLNGTLGATSWIAK
jgi:nuclease S1